MAVLICHHSQGGTDWTGTGSGQLAGVGWGTSPSRVPVESKSVPVVRSDSKWSPIGKVGECKDLLKGGKWSCAKGMTPDSHMTRQIDK